MEFSLHSSKFRLLLQIKLSVKFIIFAARYIIQFFLTEIIS